MYLWCAFILKCYFTIINNRCPGGAAIYTQSHKILLRPVVFQEIVLLKFCTDDKTMRQKQAFLVFFTKLKRKINHN